MSVTFSVRASGAMRRTMPLKIWPGPSSTQVSQPMPVKLTPPRDDTAGQPASGLIEMTLTKDAIIMGRYSNVEIWPRKVTRISYERFFGSPRSDSICHSLHLSEKTRLGKRILFCTSAANLPTIFKYLQQAGPPNMRWE